MNNKNDQDKDYLVVPNRRQNSGLPNTNNKLKPVRSNRTVHRNLPEKRAQDNENSNPSKVPKIDLENASATNEKSILSESIVENDPEKPQSDAAEAPKPNDENGKFEISTNSTGVAKNDSTEGFLADSTEDSENAKSDESNLDGHTKSSTESENHVTNGSAEENKPIAPKETNGSAGESENAAPPEETIGTDGLETENSSATNAKEILIPSENGNSDGTTPSEIANTDNLTTSNENENNDDLKTPNESETENTNNLNSPNENERFDEQYSHPPRFCELNNGNQYYAKDTDGNEKYFINDKGENEYAVQKIGNETKEVPAKAKNGSNVYIKDKNGIVKLPYNFTKQSLEFPCDPVTGNQYYMTNPRTNKKYYPKNVTGSEQYAKTKEGDEIFLENQNYKVYAKDQMGNQIYPRNKNQDQYYLKNQHYEVPARKTDGNTYYAKKRNGDQYYPRVYSPPLNEMGIPLEYYVKVNKTNIRNNE